MPDAATSWFIMCQRRERDLSWRHSHNGPASTSSTSISNRKTTSVDGSNGDNSVIHGTVISGPGLTTTNSSSNTAHFTEVILVQF
jgi:hypothetical protein